jgi:hypothetical protein
MPTKLGMGDWLTCMSQLQDLEGQIWRAEEGVREANLC